MYPCGSRQTKLTLVIGLLGSAAFFGQGQCRQTLDAAAPVLLVVPLRPYTYKTSSPRSSSSVIFTCCSTSLFPISTFRLYIDSGINILPINAFIISTGALAGALLTKLRLHWARFGVLAISCGLFSMMSPYASTSARAWFEILARIGIGFPLATQLPAVQAVLPGSDTAIQTSAYAFIRSFGFMWGTKIPSIELNSRSEAIRRFIDDPGDRAALPDGGAYSYALNAGKLTGQTLQQTLNAYKEALRII